MVPNQKSLMMLLHFFSLKIVGAELRVPEVVPFRLTPNMVAAFGPTGYEGPFRLACEAALGLMRRQKDVLISSLRPFVYDPLVDWLPKDGAGDFNQRSKAGDKSKETGEIVLGKIGFFLTNIGPYFCQCKKVP